MSRLTDLSLANRSLVALATVIVAIAGLISALTLKQELLPGVQFPMIAAVTSVPGADADVVDAQVTRAVETAAQSLDGVERVQSTSSAGLSSVLVTLDHGTDVKTARIELQAAINEVPTLPAGTTSRVVAGNVDDFPVMQVAVTPPAAELEPFDPTVIEPGVDPATGLPFGDPAATGGPDAAFVTKVREQAVPRLSKLPGVRDVQLGGTGTQVVTITLDETRAAAAGVSIQTVQAALAANGIAVPAGSITDGTSALNVQVGAPFSTVEEVQSIPLLGAYPTAVAGAAGAPAAAPSAVFNRPGASGTPSTNGAPVRMNPVTEPQFGNCQFVERGVPCTANVLCTPDPAAGPIGICTVTPSVTTSTITSTTTAPGQPAPAARTVTTTAPATTVTSTQSVTVPQYITVQAPAPVAPDVPTPTLGEVATVTMGDAPVSGYTRTNSEPSITLAIRTSAAGNTVDVSHDVRAQLADLQRLTGGTYTVVYDQAPYIEQSIEDLTVEGLLGLGFAVLVVLLFLFSLRMTIVTAVSIPLSLLIALIGLKVGGYSLNILTLAALTIAVGRVVDDSIVVVENVKRHVDAGEDRLVAIPAAVREVATAITASTLTTAAVFLPIAVVGGQVGELFRPFALTVVLALLASLLVALTIVPVLAHWLLTRRVKKAKATGAAAAGTPGEPGKAEPGKAGQTGQAAAGAGAVAGGRRGWFGRKPKAAPKPAVGGAAAAGPGAASAAQPTEVLPATPSVPAALPVGETSVLPTTPSARPAGPRPAVPGAGRPAAGPSQPKKATAAGVGTPARRTPFDRIRNSYLATLRAALARPLITLLVAGFVLGLTAGAATLLKTDFIGDSGQDTLVITQELPSGTSLAATDAATQKVEAVLADRRDLASYQVNIGRSDGAAAFTGGGETNTAQYYVTVKDDADSTEIASQLRGNLATRPELGRFTVGRGDSAGAAAVEVQITGADPEKLRLAADRVYAKVRAIQGATEVTNNLSAAVPSLRVTVNRGAAAEHGLTEASIGRIVAAALHGTPVGQVTVGSDPYGAVVVAPVTPLSVDELRNLNIGATTLGAVATVDEVATATTIERLDGERVATVSAVPADRDLGGFSRQVTTAVVNAKIPAGTSATIGGASAEQRDAFGQLGLALLAAIALVYLVMVATFRSLVQPLVLLASIPFAATGAVAMLLVTRVPLGVSAMIGLLMLVGIVVTNAIVLIDLVNRYRAQGMSVRDALLKGGAARLRPILMTALATVMALTPLALSLTGGGAFISQPLAIVVIGGLISSTLLTLVIVPVLYWLVEGRKERAAARAERAKKAPAVKAVAGNPGKAGRAGRGRQKGKPADPDAPGAPGAPSPAAPPRPAGAGPTGASGPGDDSAGRLGPGAATGAIPPVPRPGRGPMTTGNLPPVPNPPQPRGDASPPGPATGGTRPIPPVTPPKPKPPTDDDW